MLITKGLKPLYEDFRDALKCNPVVNVKFVLLDRTPLQPSCGKHVGNLLPKLGRSLETSDSEIENETDNLNRDINIMK